MAKTKRQITPMGKEIKRRLVELEMSQEELATSVGCSPQYINHIIYGERSGEKYLEQIFLVWMNIMIKRMERLPEVSIVYRKLICNRNLIMLR